MICSSARFNRLSLLIVIIDVKPDSTCDLCKESLVVEHSVVEIVNFELGEKTRRKVSTI